MFQDMIIHVLGGFLGSDPMDEMEAARQRHSVRKYTKKPLSQEHIGILRSAIDSVNREGNLNAVLMIDEPKAFSTLPLKALGFSNAVNYIAMIGPEDETLNERIGYYGERLVLLAQSLGLRTCWVMMCSKKYAKNHVREGERFVIGISIGYGSDDGRQHKDRPIEDIGRIEGAPEWFRRGIECVMLAPSGVNRQPVSFEYDGDVVTPVYKKSNLVRVDCGIAMYHFELGAGKGSFRWKDSL